MLDSPDWSEKEELALWLLEEEATVEVQAEVEEEELEEEEEQEESEEEEPRVYSERWKASLRAMAESRRAFCEANFNKNLVEIGPLVVKK